MSNLKKYKRNLNLAKDKIELLRNGLDRDLVLLMKVITIFEEADWEVEEISDNDVIGSEALVEDLSAMIVASLINPQTLIKNLL